MDLNLPIFSQVSQCKRLLIAGMGGGFDVFCGLPIYFELTKRGQNVHLANFSFSDIENLKDGTRLSYNLVGVQADQNDFAPYFPELYLSQWFQETRKENVTIWSFHKSGTYSLLKNYRLLIEHLSIDGIILIDGGVDSLIRGDEQEKGSVIEDATSLFVVNELDDIPVRILATTAFGAEHDISHGHVLENIAALTKKGAFLGSCSLTPQMDVYQAYEDAVLYVQNKPVQDPSIINSSMISATRGEFGDYHLTEKTRGHRLWISPLMSMYWFFELISVAKENKFLQEMKDTNSFLEGLHKVMAFSSRTPRRKGGNIPL